MTGKSVTELLADDAAGRARAVAILRAGGLVALPTETVYGLAARADSADAVARIYAAKGRPATNPLIVHVAAMAEAKRLARFDAAARALAAAHWPGPLTLVLPCQDGAALAPAVRAGRSTVALRMPAHPAMRAVIAAVGSPLAAPSANRSGRVSPTTAAHVLSSLGGRIDAVLDGGACPAGVESTIAAVREGGRVETLRPGPIVLAAAPAPVTADGVEAPGQLAHHYSPGKPVRLGAGAEAASDEFLIGFGPMPCTVNLSQRGDLVEAAARLYACLHTAAAAPQPRVAVAAIPDEGVGRAINDRLRRAAIPPPDPA